MRLDGFGLLVENMGEMIRFYRDVLGFEIKEEEDSSNVYLVKDGTLFLRKWMRHLRKQLKMVQNRYWNQNLSHGDREHVILLILKETLLRSVHGINHSKRRMRRGRLKWHLISKKNIKNFICLKRGLRLLQFLR